SSDNIPGVAGIGPKTAVTLLATYDTLDAIYQQIDQIKGATQKKLLAGKESAYLSQKLARIVTDIPMQLDLEACLAHNFDPNPVLDIFHELEFRTLSELLRERSATAVDILPAAETVPDTETIIGQSQAQLNQLVTALNQANLIAFDVETTGLDEVTAELVGICLAVEPPAAYYIPVGHLAQPRQSSEGQMAL